MSALVINDIDAGLGHFDNTQITVNNQIVVGSLMNLCDNPKQVSVSQGWRDGDLINRVPIIVTGNDFSTLFAPLVRSACGGRRKLWLRARGCAAQVQVRARAHAAGTAGHESVCCRAHRSRARPRCGLR